MATLYVSYVVGVDKEVADGVVGSETVTTSGTSAQTGVIPKHAGIAILFSDTAHYVTIGNDPTAAAGNSIYVPANVQREIRIRNYGSQTLKIAAITA